MRVIAASAVVSSSVKGGGGGINCGFDADSRNIHKLHTINMTTVSDDYGVLLMTMQGLDTL